MNTPTLSVIIPMRDGVPVEWLKELANVKGNVEFILVFPPSVKQFPNDIDNRIKQINSPIQGEVTQRITALLNASGTYVLSINCDEYLYPDIEQLTLQYFQKFPNNWFIRLRTKYYEYGSQAELVKEWEKFPEIENIKIKTTENKELSELETMREIPISPIENKLDLMCMFRPFPGRKDLNGPHQENFDKKIWKNSIVQENLQDIVKLFTIFGPFKYIPFWCADRLLGLSTQAKLYEKELVKQGQIVAHWLPLPAQIRTENNPPEYRGKNRRYVLAEVFLLRIYPQYGYFWNLILSQWRSLIK